ncbi:hypothetical protein Cflav_PD6051 [Pedosphaera parvula Ellin514]|uniref:Uncharacterized protein n=1 Tax=Pedosphaera parvula (strain Ellin514) TaxID=320771 RepID=B9XA75_PEDPL|nr:hypothetical protein Cflav_PD6051 [Pedosphaera parvula Ellin514]
MQLKNLSSAIGKSFSDEELLSELKRVLSEYPDAFPVPGLCSPGWSLKFSMAPGILSLQCHRIGNNILKGYIQVRFTEFLQRDCQDVMIEDERSGTLKFVLNCTNGEIEFSAEPYSVREYDPEEF